MSRERRAAPGPERPLRILVIGATPYFADRGCHVRIQGQVQALEKLGHQVTVLTYGLGRDVPGGTILRTAPPRGPGRLDAAPSLGKLPLDLALLLLGIKEARRSPPDLIHGHTQEGGLIALILGRLVGVPVVVDLQSRRVAEELVEYGKSRVGGLLYRLADLFDHLVPRRAEAVVASTEAIAAWVEAEARPRGPVRVVADAVPGVQEPPCFEPELARRLGLDPGRPIVVYLGLLSELQGVDLLLAAAARLAGEPSPPQLLIMGYPDHERWRERAGRLGLAGLALFPGRIPYAESPRYLALGALAVSAKRSSLQGNGKLLLYMACERAVLALDTPTNRAILGPDGLYAPDDAERFAAAIREALADPAGLRSRGRSLRARLGGEATPEGQARVLLAVYRRLLGAEDP